MKGTRFRSRLDRFK